MFTQLKQFFVQFAVPPVARLERAYLDAAVSRYDLERRERDVERGLFRQSYASF